MLLTFVKNCVSKNIILLFENSKQTFSSQISTKSGQTLSQIRDFVNSFVKKLFDFNIFSIILTEIILTENYYLST